LEAIIVNMVLSLRSSRQFNYPIIIDSGHMSCDVTCIPLLMCQQGAYM